MRLLPGISSSLVWCYSKYVGDPVKTDTCTPAIAKSITSVEYHLLVKKPHGAQAVEEAALDL